MCHLLELLVALLKFGLLPGFYLRILWLALQFMSMIKFLQSPSSPFRRYWLCGGQRNLTANPRVCIFSLLFTHTDSQLAVWPTNPLRWTSNAKMSHYFKRCCPQASPSLMKLDVAWWSASDRGLRSLHELFDIPAEKAISISPLQDCDA